MQEHKYSIKNWALDDRPREKLRMKGSENLVMVIFQESLEVFGNIPAILNNWL